mgnify:CR=1 FL=1
MLMDQVTLLACNFAERGIEQCPDNAVSFVLVQEMPSAIPEQMLYGIDEGIVGT